MNSRIYKYRMLVQARTDLTDEEIASRATRPKMSNECGWPFRDTGEIIHARRRQQAVKFYAALRQVKPPIKVRAVKINEPRSQRLHTIELFRAWGRFDCILGSVNGVEDEVKHFEVDHGLAACGINFTTYSRVCGKPECDKCLAVAVNCHPEMKQYL